jgi:hypothetical protein
MSAVAAILVPILTQAGAPILKNLIRRHAGAGTADIAEDVIDALSGSLGVQPTPEAIAEAHKADPATVEATIRDLEASQTERWLSLQEAAIKRQFDLLTLETKAGGLKDSWRWGWMWLLAGFWTWQVIATAFDVPTLDAAILMTLTTWFISLYMGGHTIKELGKSVSDAMRKDKP